MAPCALRLQCHGKGGFAAKPCWRVKQYLCPAGRPSRVSARQPSHFSCFAKRSNQEKATPMMAVRCADCTRRWHRNREASETRCAQTADASFSDFGTSDVSPSTGTPTATATAEPTATATVAARNVKDNCNCRCAERQKQQPLSLREISACVVSRPGQASMQNARIGVNGNAAGGLGLATCHPAALHRSVQSGAAASVSPVTLSRGRPSIFCRVCSAIISAPSSLRRDASSRDFTLGNRCSSSSL